MDKGLFTGSLGQSICFLLVVFKSGQIKGTHKCKPFRIRVATSAATLELDMSVIIKNEHILRCMPVIVPSYRDKWEVRSLDFVPEHVQNCPPQAKINVSESPHDYILTSALPDVELKNLWVVIKGRSLFIYAGVTGKKQENDEYCYTEEPFRWITGEITLPERASQKPKMALFLGRVLILTFSKREIKPPACKSLRSRKIIHGHFRTNRCK